MGTPGRICLRLRSRISLIFLYISGWSFCNCFPSLDPLRRTLTNLFSNMHMFSKKVNFTWTSIFIRIYFHLQAFFFHHSVILLEHFHWLFTLFIFLMKSFLPHFCECTPVVCAGLSSFSMLAELAMLSLLSFLPDLLWKKCQFPCFVFFTDTVVYGLI